MNENEKPELVVVETEHDFVNDDSLEGHVETSDRRDQSDDHGDNNDDDDYDNANEEEKGDDSEEKDDKDKEEADEQDKEEADEQDKEEADEQYNEGKWVCRQGKHKGVVEYFLHGQGMFFIIETSKKLKSHSQ